MAQFLPTGFPTITFVQPLALLLLLALIPLWVLALALPKRVASWRFWVSLVLRSAVIMTLVLALAGTQLVRPVAAVATVFLLDRSESITPAAAARAEQFVRDSLQTRRPEDRAGVVLFGQNALVAQVPSDVANLAPFTNVPIGEQTNIEQAAELGISLFPADANKRMVILSDGGQNAGDVQRVAQQALQRGVSISYVDLGGAAESAETLLAGLSAPARTREGQSLALNATVESTVAQTAQLKLFDGDQVVFDQAIAIQAGTTVVPIEVPAHTAGFQRYRAEITPQNDTQPKNNSAEALVQVDGPPRVLVVEGTAGEGQPLHDALVAASVNADLVLPAALPGDLAGLANYESIVLVNVPAVAIAPASQQQIASYVRDLGRGLVVVGGGAAYGVGGYSGTPIAAALPVSTDVRDQKEHPKIAIIYILDKSRSMQNCHCNGPNRETDTDRSYFVTGRQKIDIGKDAVLQSVATLAPEDTVGIVTFDGSANVPFPLQTQVTPAKVLQVIAPIPADGIATDISSGLVQAQELMRTSDAKIKHVVLMTDGWGTGTDPAQIAASMKAEGVTVSVIADGGGSSPTLQQLADAGGGRYLPAANPEDIPHLFVDETNQVLGNYLVETPFTPAYGRPSPILEGLTGGLPQLYGYNATTAKQTATVSLLGLNDAPVLAQWQYGLGKAVAWTSDTKGQWAKDWIGWAGFARFAAQMVDWTLPARLDSGLTPEIKQENGALHIAATLATGDKTIPAQVTATLIGSDGARREVPLAANGPGQYQAQVPLPSQGSYLVQLVAIQNGQPIAQATAGVALPYSAEYSLNQHNPALLASLAASTGGKAIVTPGETFAPTPGQPATSAQDIARELMLAALLLLPLDVVVRRLLGR